MSHARDQGELWGRASRNWSQLMEPLMRPLYEAAVDALEPLEGQTFLDAGCGAGLFLSLAAARGAIVSGLDASEGMLAIARSRCQSAKLRLGSIEALPYEDDTFDIVTALDAIQFAADPNAAVEELVRVVLPGGRVGIGVWSYPQQCESERVFNRLRELVPQSAAPPPPGVSLPGVVEQVLDDAGVDDVRSVEVQCPFIFEDLETAWLAWSSTGVISRAIRVAGQAAIRGVVEEMILADRKPDGTLRQDNAFRFVVGSKAATEVSARLA